MIGVGASVPAAIVWTDAGPTGAISLDRLAEGGPFLLVFYLFDWSST